MSTRDSKAHEAKKRPARVKLGQGSKLAIANVYATDKSKQYHLFLDNPGELEGAVRAWWDYVVDDDGNKIKMPAGNGLTHYLMSMPKKMYEEDMAEQQELITATTRSKIKVKGSNYSPEGYDSMVTRDRPI